MLVTLDQPPLAAHLGRTTYGVSTAQRLDVHSGLVAGVPGTARPRPDAGRGTAPTRDPAGDRLAEAADHPRRADRPASGQGSAEAVPPRIREQGLSEHALHAQSRQQPVADRRDRILERDRRPRGRRQDRSRRRRNRPAEHVLRSDRIHVPARVPKGPDRVHDPEGDRRSRLSGAGIGEGGHAPPRPEGVVPRYPRRRYRRGRRGNDRPGRLRSSGGEESVRRRHRGPGSAAIASSTYRRRSETAPTRPRSSPRSRTRSPTGWT